MSDHDTLDDFVLVADPEWNVDSGSETDAANQQQACSVAAAANTRHEPRTDVLPAAEHNNGSFSAAVGAAADVQEHNQVDNQGAAYPDASKDVAHASTAQAGFEPDQFGAAGAKVGGTAAVTNARKLACESELQRLCHSVGHYIGPELSADLEYWRARLQTETAREQGEDAFRQHFDEVLTAAQKLCQTDAGEPTEGVPGWHWVQCSACRRCRLVSGAAFCELSLSDEETVFNCSMNIVDWTAPSCKEPSHFRVSA